MLSIDICSVQLQQKPPSLAALHLCVRLPDCLHHVSPGVMGLGHDHLVSVNVHNVGVPADTPAI